MPSTSPLLRLLHTTRYLHARQIVGQLRNRLPPLVSLGRIHAQRTPPYGGCRWRPVADFLPPGPQENPAGDILRGRLTFLNDPRQIGWPPRWNDDQPSRLWRYNLHYFEYLWALDYTEAKALVLDWIEQHPLRRRHVGWEPYPTSLRLVNWCCVFFGRLRAHTEADERFRSVLWRSIYLQAQWLRRNVETHLMGNHLFENGAALAVLGCCFGGAAARDWRRRGIGILREQIPEQVLSDGGHFERSPMYHSRVLYLLLLLMNTGEEELQRLVRPAAAKMREALAVMCHPDGQIALLNDSALGIYNEPAQLMQHAGNLEPDHKAGVFALPETGYFGARGENGDYVICDAGPVGPDYIPGHAHGDIFSFELSLRGHRVIVDSGVCDYLPGETRSYCRSTRAHNTVEIDAHDQCEFWSVFRVARRGRPRDVVWRASEGGFHLSAWHDGYRRLGGSPRHQRRFTWRGPGGLEIEDRITASRPVDAVARLHLHWTCQIAKMSPPMAEIAYPAGTFTIRFSGDGVLTSEESYCCPEFGKKLPNTALAFSSRGSNIYTSCRIEWR